jgi:RND family efflux transporter MFP subunit
MSISKMVRQFPDHTMHVPFAFFRIRPLLIVGSLLLPLVACDSGNAYKPPPPPNVTVSHPQRDQVVDAIEFTGNTQAFYTVQLRARVDGYLEKVLFKEGDIVDEGKTLFLIQQQSYIAKVKEAEANLLSAKAKLMHSETEFKRYTGLMKEEAAAQTDVDHWHYERDSNRAAVMANEAQLDIAKLNLSYTTVKAPFRGKVSRRYADPGNVVGHGEETVLAEINKIDPLYVYFTISERDLLKIRQTMDEGDMSRRAKSSPNMPIEVGLANEEGYPHEALLDYADIQIDPSTGTMQLRATLPNSDFKLLPGLFVRIRAEKPGIHEGLLVPEDAVAFDQAGAYVLVVDAQGVVSRRGIELGALDHKRYEVTAGLTDEEWVIVNGQMRAIPGKKVTPLKQGEAQGSANP